MSAQSERAESVKLLIESCTVFVKELTALVTACKTFVEQQGGTKK